MKYKDFSSKKNHVSVGPIQYDITKEDDLEKVFNQYFPLVLSICRKYYFRSYDNDDLYQEARIVCFKTINSYDPQRKPLLVLFIS